jgi:hypothetical protein
MRRILSSITLVFAGLVLFLFVLTFVFQEKQYERYLQFSGLVLFICVIICSLIMNVLHVAREHGAWRAYLRIFSGPLLLVLAAFWTACAARFGVSHLMATGGFLFLLAVGFVLIGYEVLVSYRSRFR